MAINMMNETDYISCPKCNEMIFEEKETFVFKRIKGNKATYANKEVVNKKWSCVKCGADVTSEINKYEAI